MQQRVFEAMQHSIFHRADVDSIEEHLRDGLRAEHPEAAWGFDPEREPSLTGAVRTMLRWMYTKLLSPFTSRRLFVQLYNNNYISSCQKF